MNALSSSVYAYTRDVITQLRAQGTAPDMVQVGYEVNAGMLWEVGRSSNMANFVKLTNAGATAVRDASGGMASMPAIMVHVAKTGNAAETVAGDRNIVAVGGWLGTTGPSYCPTWHGDFASLSGTVSALRSNFPWARVYITETALSWSANQVGCTNLPYPQTPQGQYDSLKALTPVVRNAGGSGIFSWGAFWSQSGNWSTAPDWKDDDASRRSLFDDGGRATKAVNGLN